jgi:hypothetical protein
VRRRFLPAVFGAVDSLTRLFLTCIPEPPPDLLGSAEATGTGVVRDETKGWPRSFKNLLELLGPNGQQAGHVQNGAGLPTVWLNRQRTGRSRLRRP